MKFKFKTNNTKENFYNLFGHLRSRLFLSDTLYIDVGRFSLGIVSRVRFHTNCSFTGVAARVGDYCEFAECEVLLGGEHLNDRLVNMNFSSSPVFQQVLLSNGFDVRHSRKGILQIGCGVVVGHAATILSGVTIGDGVVIGASSLISRDCEPFSIYAGNPARKIKERSIDQYAFRDIVSCSIAELFAKITGKGISNNLEESHPSDRVHIRIQFVDPVKGGVFAYQVTGANVADKYFPLAKGSAFYKYCMQANLPGGSEMDWYSNPLALDMSP